MHDPMRVSEHRNVKAVSLHTCANMHVSAWTPQTQAKPGISLIVTLTVQDTFLTSQDTFFTSC